MRLIFINRLVLIDWKTSEKKKSTLSSTFDTPLQIAAYAGAFNNDPRYPVGVQNALVAIFVNKLFLHKSGRGWETA